MYFSASKIQTIFGVQNALKFQVAVFINVADLKTVVAETSGLQMKPAQSLGREMFPWRWYGLASGPF